MSSNTDIIGWHPILLATGQCHGVESLKFLGLLVSDGKLEVTATGTVLLRIHTPTDGASPTSVICECWGRQRFAGVFCRKLCSAHPPRACHRPLPSRHLKQAFLYGSPGSTQSEHLSFMLHSFATGQLTPPLDVVSRA